MDFSFSEDQTALRDLARRILEERVTPERLKQIEASPDRFDAETWRALAEANLLGVAVPEPYGGMGFGLVELCVLLSEVGRAVAPVPVYASLVLGALPVAAFGSEAQRARLLPGVADGSRLLTAALTELANEDPLRPATTARRDGRGWRLTGRKDTVPAAHLAQCVLVPARTSEGAVGLFLLDPQGPGVTLERQLATGQEVQGRLVLEDAPLGEEALLGGREQPTAALQWIVERATVGLCALELGVAERALRITADYVTKREQFERPVGSFQAVHQRAGDAFIDVEALRWTTWRAATRLALEATAPEDVAIAKFWAAEGGHRVVYAAQHLHGGIGVDVDYPVHRYYLWSRQIELTLGSAQRQLARLGDLIAAAG